jgi:hypothetical protein
MRIGAPLDLSLNCNTCEQTVSCSSIGGTPDRHEVHCVARMRHHQYLIRVPPTCQKSSVQNALNSVSALGAGGLATPLSNPVLSSPPADASAVAAAPPDLSASAVAGDGEALTSSVQWMPASNQAEAQHSNSSLMSQMQHACRCAGAGAVGVHITKTATWTEEIYMLPRLRLVSQTRDQLSPGTQDKVLT